MEEKRLSLEERMDLQDARIGIITKALSQMFHEMAALDDVELAQDTRPWDPAKINWKETEGGSGLYEKATDGLDYDLLMKDLRAHNDKFRKGGYFYWVFQRGDAIGRKKVK